MNIHETGTFVLHFEKKGGAGKYALFTQCRTFCDVLKMLEWKWSKSVGKYSIYRWDGFSIYGEEVGLGTDIWQSLVLRRAGRIDSIIHEDLSASAPLNAPSKICNRPKFQSPSIFQSNPPMSNIFPHIDWRLDTFLMKVNIFKLTCHIFTNDF